MAADDEVLRVFWPSDAPKSTSQGTLVGWRNSRLDIFVVSILQDVEVGVYKSYNPAALIHKIATPS